MNSEEPIKLETLLPLREFMTTLQLERFGDYLANRKPAKPFTDQEVKELKYMREAILETRRQFNAELNGDDEN